LTVKPDKRKDGLEAPPGERVGDPRGSPQGRALRARVQERLRQRRHGPARGRPRGAARARRAGPAPADGRAGQARGLRGRGAAVRRGRGRPSWAAVWPRPLSSGRRLRRPAVGGRRSRSCRRCWRRARCRSRSWAPFTAPCARSRGPCGPAREPSRARGPGLAPRGAALQGGRRRRGLARWSEGDLRQAFVALDRADRRMKSGSSRARRWPRRWSRRCAGEKVRSAIPPGR
jgi:hypothetical protein